MAKKRPGDVVYVNRNGLYQHYGVYVGNGKVIHKTDKGVQEVSLEQFRRQSPTYHIKPSYKPKKALKRAKSRLGEKSYNLFTDNCEHFSSSCSSGFKHSSQVENFITGAAVIAGGLAFGWLAYLSDRD